MRVPEHALKECGGRVEKAATGVGARERFWKYRQRQRPRIESAVPTDIDSFTSKHIEGRERTAACA